ncbi:TPA: hypothetical protein ACX4FZ_003985, partial [Escherichia coli]
SFNPTPRLAPPSTYERTGHGQIIPGVVLRGAFQIRIAPHSPQQNRLPFITDRSIFLPRLQNQASGLAS